MSLAAVWIEDKAGSMGPLCFASDSRTTPGPIEGINKVLLFRRTDVAAVWAGDFRYAALLANHLDAVLTATEAMRERDIDVAQALAQVERSAMRHLRIAVSPAVPVFEMNPLAQAPGPTSIVVGGYSIKLRSHVLLRIDWDANAGVWDTSLGQADPGRIVLIGDERKRAKKLAKRARRHSHVDSGWRMEPLLAVHHACCHPGMPTIGGDVQLAKAYVHGSARAYGILDPARPAVSVRGTHLTSRAARELDMRGLVVHLSSWSLANGCFDSLRSAESGL